MRAIWCLTLAGALAIAGGCKSPADPSATAPAAPGKKIKSKAKATEQATPDLALRGRVTLVNPQSRSVILTFPLGWLPPLERRLNVYRDGIKVGEVKITGPQMDTNIAADLLLGQAASGDEVRED